MDKIIFKIGHMLHKVSAKLMKISISMKEKQIAKLKGVNYGADVRF